ncbi:unnamed protein product [Fraxinus pennsylvanica]|uniref:RING-type domain-containing protein n=1 Tax=Fraxinus pennsylvanica TaxID=56036 RepID=A0AAD1Z8B7_9LAMI|nr:unnamed protein product [Fraxinus pennsylvanica]
MSSLLYTPPLPPSLLTNADSVSAMPTDTINIPQQPPYIDDSSSSSPPSESSNSSSIIIVIVVIASAIIVSSFIYLFIRFLSKRFHHRTFSDVHLQRNTSAASNNTNSNQYQVASNNLLDPLPLFDFRSVTGNLAGGDCAVCLSKFEPHDQLRLLPLCCHAFHAVCIDTWLVTNQTCPLCRSTVKPSDSDVLDKIHSVKHPVINHHYNNNSSLRNGNGNDYENSGSFRVEIGSISHRRGATESGEGRRQTYSVGSFEYIVDDDYEVSVRSTTHRPHCTSLDKQSSVRVPGGEVLAREDSVGRNWIMDYIDRLPSMSTPSRTTSFRTSGSFFSDSSRRSDSIATVEDLEANRIGEEISEFFQWLSGV